MVDTKRLDWLATVIDVGFPEAGTIEAETSAPVTAALIRAAAAEIQKLRSTMERAAKIIDDNLYHQREKVKDAASILRRALANE